MRARVAMFTLRQPFPFGAAVVNATPMSSIVPRSISASVGMPLPFSSHGFQSPVYLRSRGSHLATSRAASVRCARARATRACSVEFSH